MKHITFVWVLFFWAGHQQALAQPSLPEAKKGILLARIDSILQGEVDADRIPGAVVEVKQSGRLIIRKAYGFANRYNYDHSPAIPPEIMTPEHLFDIASLTKVVGTTTSVMLLADKGILKVDDPVYLYVPGFGTPEKRSITLRHLLTHTAGLAEWYPLYYRCSNKKESYKLIEDLPLRFPVGRQRKYSDLGFVILGEIIEKVSGMPLEQFMEKNIFIPLDMLHTTYNPLARGGFTRIASTSHGNPYEKRMVHDSALGFRVPEIDPDSWNGWRTYTLRGEVNDGNAWYANGGISGAAGLFSTADDLQKLVDILLAGGKAGTTRFLQQKTIDLFLTKDAFGNGLGWMMDPAGSFMKNAPPGSFGHTGFTGTSIVVVPGSALSVILLINRQNRGLLLSGEYYNVTPVRRQVFEAVMQAL